MDEFQDYVQNEIAKGAPLLYFDGQGDSVSNEEEIGSHCIIWGFVFRFTQ